MKKAILILFFFVVALTSLFISCNKSEKVTAQSKPALIFKTDVERDANSAALAKLISEDNDWKTLKQINYEFLDVVVKSNVPITSNMLNASNPALEKLYSKEFLAKFDEAKKLAGRLKEKYFQNSKECYSCETMTEAKWKSFGEKVNTFRNNKSAYNQFLTKLGVKSEKNISSMVDPDPISPAPDCNNWRFTLCGGACVVTAPTVVIFAACMAMCIAEFC
jgi:hypothetical protein